MRKILIFFTIFICFIILVNSKINERMFNWQSHSYNDLRQYPQLLLKNTKLFKVDIYFASDKVCTEAISLNSNSNNKKDLIDQKFLENHVKNNLKTPLCFVLTHDDPVEGIKYYKAESIFEFVVDSRFTNYFQTNETYWALCFKNVPKDVCTNSSYTNLVNK